MTAVAVRAWLWEAVAGFGSGRLLVLVVVGLLVLALLCLRARRAR